MLAAGQAAERCRLPREPGAGPASVGTRPRDYQRQYRRTQSNRDAARRRQRVRRRATRFAKMDASTLLSRVPSGTCRIVPSSAGEFAKMDAWIVEMTSCMETGGAERGRDRGGRAELLGLTSMNTQCLDLDLRRLDLRFAGARLAEPRGGADCLLDRARWPDCPVSCGGRSAGPRLGGRRRSGSDRWLSVHRRAAPARSRHRACRAWDVIWRSRCSACWRGPKTGRLRRSKKRCWCMNWYRAWAPLSTAAFEMRGIASTRGAVRPRLRFHDILVSSAETSWFVVAGLRQLLRARGF